MTLKIKGKVQKVGFRYSVVDFVANQQNSLVGYVKNEPDGSVEVVAQGNIESLKELHRFCTSGPAGAEVREMTEDFSSISKFTFSDFTLVS